MAELKNKIRQLFGSLFMEKNKDEWVASIGRVSWWLVFIPAIFIWASSGGSLDAGEATKDISPNHLSVLVLLAGYNFGKKVMDSVKDVVGNNDSPE